MQPGGFSFTPSMPEKLDRCVRKLMAEGHDKDSAYAICNASLNKESTMDDRKAKKQQQARRRQLKEAQLKAELEAMQQADKQAKEEEPETKEEKCESPIYMYYGGATTLADALAAMDAQEKAQAMHEALYLFNNVVNNILASQGIEDKSEAIGAAAKELQKLLSNPEPLMKEAETETKADTPPVVELSKEESSLWSKFKKLIGLEEKAGARHSSSDQEALDAAHDAVVKAGGYCPGAMKVLKGEDGEYYAFGLVSNNFRDKDDEIITEKAHQDFIAYLDLNPGEAPEFWSWHTPGTARKSRATWWDYSNGFLCMVWPLTKEEAKQFGEDEDIGMSHGFNVLARDDKQSPALILGYRSFEASDLPPQSAANPYTSLETIRKESAMAFTPQKREYLIKRFGEDKVKELEGKPEELKKALESLGVEYKETQPETPATKTQLPEVDEHILNQVKELLNVDGLNKVITELQQANKELADRLKAQDEKLESLSKSDDEKVAEIIAPKVKPVAWGFQPSTAKETAMTEEQKKAMKSNAPTGWVAEAFAPITQ